MVLATFRMSLLTSVNLDNNFLIGMPRGLSSLMTMDHAKLTININHHKELRVVKNLSSVMLNTESFVMATKWLSLKF